MLVFVVEAEFNCISNKSYYWTIDKSNINQGENQRSLLSQNLSKIS
ncbi:MAG: hypothetical protein F6K17_39810 [Okeania sp. SIO3C4]|nr:hypothetical protein [Okeania sp. SIO3B3]NER08260.1 hypothetical protein [Okeania sp. SIO3C4]